MVVHTVRGCLNIDLVDVAVDSIVLEVNCGIRVLKPGMVNEPLHRNDYTGGKVWCWVPDTFVDHPKKER